MHCYEHLASLAERMLTQARTGLWGELPALEAQCSELVDRLQAIEAQETLNQAQSGRKYLLLSRISVNYAEISSLVMPQLAKLGAVMMQQSQRQSLHQAYGLKDDVLR